MQVSRNRLDIKFTHPHWVGGGPLARLASQVALHCRLRLIAFHCPLGLLTSPAGLPRVGALEPPASLPLIYLRPPRHMRTLLTSMCISFSAGAVDASSFRSGCRQISAEESGIPTHPCSQVDGRHTDKGCVAETKIKEAAGQASTFQQCDFSNFSSHCCIHLSKS